MLVAWVVTPFGLVARFQHFVPEDRGSMFLRNIIYPQVHTALQPRGYVTGESDFNRCSTGLGMRLRMGSYVVFYTKACVPVPTPSSESFYTSGRVQ